jgi:hypothetical protein
MVTLASAGRPVCRLRAATAALGRPPAPAARPLLALDVKVILTPPCIFH